MINTREIAAEYRLAHWAQIIRERRESGLSVKAYCRQIGICGNTYFYWQRRLREAASLSRQELVAGRETEAVSLVPKGWAVCEPEKSIARRADTVTISIGKCHITAAVDTDLELLKSVILTLTGIC